MVQLRAGVNKEERGNKDKGNNKRNKEMRKSEKGGKEHGAIDIITNPPFLSFHFLYFLPFTAIRRQEST